MVYLVFSHHRVRIFSILPWSLAHFLSDFTRTYQSGVLEHSLKITGFGEEYVDWTSYERSIRTKKHTGRNLMSFGGSPEEKTTNDTSAHNRTRGRTTRRRLRLISYFTSAIWCEERWTKRIDHHAGVTRGSRSGRMSWRSWWFSWLPMLGIELSQGLRSAVRPFWLSQPKIVTVGLVACSYIVMASAWDVWF